MKRRAWAVGLLVAVSFASLSVKAAAPKRQVHKQGFVVSNVFSTLSATYEDNALDYVTSEPALDYTVNTILLHSLL